MTRYIVEVPESGELLFDGEARSIQDALEQMADEHGYADLADMAACQGLSTDEYRETITIRTADR